MPFTVESFELVSKKISQSQCPLKLSKGSKESMCGILNNHVNHLSSPDSKKTALDDYGNRSILKTAWLFIHIYIYTCTCVCIDIQLHHDRQ